MENGSAGRGNGFHPWVESTAGPNKGRELLRSPAPETSLKSAAQIAARGRHPRAPGKGNSAIGAMPFSGRIGPPPRYLPRFFSGGSPIPAATPPAYDARSDSNTRPRDRERRRARGIGHGRIAVMRILRERVTPAQTDPQEPSRVTRLVGEVEKVLILADDDPSIGTRAASPAAGPHAVDRGRCVLASVIRCGGCCGHEIRSLGVRKIRRPF